ncbi:hypothetical protein D5S18_17075 [Nocardia panacis]|uniref:Uncharacterized protein n=1 Tax=Nocardia panacis TaxID=2340916 RepID=A0A3A4KPZ2_9NOCA|nr:hypothetical protein [Nocardia panacis]RJO75090.1 hypothetical protein D5S18_17075 [Nocardia panacis]
MSDEQIGFDIDVEQTVWGKWVDPARRAAQVRRFLDRIGLSALPPKVWEFESPEASRIGGVIADLFPDTETAVAPENSDVADQFVCFVGECFIRYAGARWYDHARYGRTSEDSDIEPVELYQGIEPGVVFDPDSGSRSYTAGYLVGYTVRYGFGGFNGTAGLILAGAMLHEGRSSHAEDSE